MKTLSLVECLELKFPGNILKDALCFGDVDNDGLNEIIAGNTDGDLFIYKDGKCICRAFDLGCIAAIAVGNLLNNNRNVTVVATTEGYCHIFDVEDELSTAFPDDESRNDPSVSSTSADNPQSIPLDCRVIQQFHSQRIVANTKVMFLSDVNDDSEVELVLGLTDRVLRTYKWNPEPVTDYSMNLEERDEDAKSESIGGSVYDGRLQAVNKWELANQIGSIAPHRQGNLVSILIGQPGGSVTRITEISEENLLKNSVDVEKTAQSSSAHFQRGESMEKELPSGQQDHSVLRHATPSDNISIKYYALNSTKMRNSNISTDVAGNIMSHDGKNEDSYACATYDGTILICKDDIIEWSFYVDKPLLTVQSFCGSAIIVDWEGPTYLINRTLDPAIQNCVFRFYFEDHVAAFRVGMYGMRRGSSVGNTEMINQKCFAYVTFHGSIYIYPNAYL